MIDKIMDLGVKFVNTRLMSEFLDWFGALSPFMMVVFLMGIVFACCAVYVFLRNEWYHIKYGYPEIKDYYEGCDEEMRRKGL